MKRYVISFTLVLLMLCFLLTGCSQNTVPEGEPESETKASADTVPEEDYAHTLFQTDFVHQIDIRIAEEDWNDLLADPVSKTKYHADIVIDGEEIKDVSFAAKGNSSLYFVAYMGDTSRYSFRVNFGKFVKGQTYHGLDTLSLNNSFSDATLMRDYVCYEVFRQAGVPAPLTSYVWLTVNGKDNGLYQAVEDEKRSFLAREYNGEGVIYKPESQDTDLTMDMIEDIIQNGLPPEEPRGCDLVYTDDDPESYPDIFENAETDADDEDTLAVIAALKNLSEGTNLNDSLDIDKILRFFAAHNFVLNYDSYTGPMPHNVAMYENNGRLSLIPWDYNLSFGTYIPGLGSDVLNDATDILNRGIDSPLVGTTAESRPMWKWIAEDESYQNEYHQAMDALLTDYFESGEFEQQFNTMYELLLPYVEKDPTAFYSPDQFKSGCEVLKEFCLRRAESVRKQLNGELSSFSEKQDDKEKVDASDLHILDMGAAVFGD